MTNLKPPFQKKPAPAGRKGSGKKPRRWFRLLAWTAGWFALYGLTAFFSVTYFVKGSGTIAAPDLRQMTLEEARTLGLQTGVSVTEVQREASDEVEEGRILEQTPAPGFALKRGQSVFVTVSLGVPGANAPDLNGKVLPEAEEILRRQRLVLGDVLRVHSDSVPENVVMAQEPGPEATAFPGTAVHLAVSAGPETEWLCMPHLTKISSSSALAALRSSGLKPQVLEKETSQPEERGAVLVQYPPGGARFRRGDPITLTVGK